MYQKCRKFGHLAYNCRNKKKKAKGKLIPQNKFEVITSRVIQCGVKKEVKVRKQEIVEEEIQFFRYWGVEHYKWEYLSIKVEKERRRSEKVACVVSLQKVQQEKRLVYSLWRKEQKYCNKRDMLPRGTTLEK